MGFLRSFKQNSDLQRISDDLMICIKRLCKIQIGLQDRVTILRKYEVFSYRIAFFLLKKEEDAIQAASQSLLELGQDEAFFLVSEMTQRRKVKDTTIRESMVLRQKINS